MLRRGGHKRGNLVGVGRMHDNEIKPLDQENKEAGVLVGGKELCVSPQQSSTILVALSNIKP